MLESITKEQYSMHFNDAALQFTAVLRDNCRLHNVSLVVVIGVVLRMMLMMFMLMLTMMVLMMLLMMLMIMVIGT